MTSGNTTTIVQDLLRTATEKGQGALSEFDSKRVLAAYGVPVTAEKLAESADGAVQAATELGFPVAIKACGPDLLHKTDRGLVHLNLPDTDAVRAAVKEIGKALTGSPVDGYLVQRMVTGRREVIAGGLRDPLYGPCVMVGLGGVAVEALGDVSFRLAPLERRDALEMLEELQSKAIFGPFRGECVVDTEALAEVLCSVGRLLVDLPQVAQVDVNPLLLEEGRPVAVDALITLQSGEAVPEPAPPVELSERQLEQFRAFVEPESVAIIGATDSVLKWGFRILFNTIEGGYTGRLYGVNPKYEEIIGVPCFPSVDALPEAVDLVLIVVPPPAVADALRACAEKGIGVVLVITAGFGEVDDEKTKAAQQEVARIAEETGMLVIGPNCAGVASPAPYNLYCGMISRFPGAGGLTIVSQSGNVGATVLTWARLHQVGIARFISTGNEAATKMEDYLSFMAVDPRTDVIISYVEGTTDGRRLYEALRHTAEKKPLIFVKGGRTDAGLRAAQSHTGALAGETRLLRAACRQAGVAVVNDVYEAMEVGAVFLRGTLPKGRRVVIASQGGGWGVLGADASADAGLDVIRLPDDLFAELDSFLPPWWSHNNPIDTVAGNDMSLFRRSIEAAIKHPDVDAVIVLGVGYISSALNRYEDSPLALEIGLDKMAKIGSGMELDDMRGIAETAKTCGKPVMVASDTVLLAYGPKPNAAIQELENLGIYAFSSPVHAARALAHMAERYEFLHGIPRARPKG